MQNHSGTLSGCNRILGATGGDARKTSRHAPAINLGAYRRPRHYCDSFVVVTVILAVGFNARAFITVSTSDKEHEVGVDDLRLSSDGRNHHFHRRPSLFVP